MLKWTSCEWETLIKTPKSLGHSFLQYHVALEARFQAHASLMLSNFWWHRTQITTTKLTIVFTNVETHHLIGSWIKVPNASHIVTTTTRDMNIGIIIYVNCSNEADRKKILNRVSNEIKNNYEGNEGWKSRKKKWNCTKYLQWRLWRNLWKMWLHRTADWHVCMPQFQS
jgi:hypothetical protein